MRLYFRRRFEVFMISIARKIIHGRNVHRCQVVSRRDNNDMYSMGERLESIEARMLDKYNKTENR